MTKQKIIVANWKMNISFNEAEKFIKQIKPSFSGVKNAKIIICPSFVSLAEVNKEIARTKIDLGAQDVFWLEEGAFTGEISIRSLKEIGCKYIIIGHSERRTYMEENDIMINKKLQIFKK